MYSLLVQWYYSYHYIVLTYVWREFKPFEWRTEFLFTGWQVRQVSENIKRATCDRQWPVGNRYLDLPVKKPVGIPMDDTCGYLGWTRSCGHPYLEYLHHILSYVIPFCHYSRYGTYWVVTSTMCHIYTSYLQNLSVPSILVYMMLFIRKTCMVCQTIDGARQCCQHSSAPAPRCASQHQTELDRAGSAGKFWLRCGAPKH